MNAALVIEAAANVAMLAAFFAPRFSPNVRLACFILCLFNAVTSGIATLAFVMTGDLFMILWLLAFTVGSVLAARRYARFGLRRVTRSQTEAA